MTTLSRRGFLTGAGALAGAGLLGGCDRDPELAATDPSASPLDYGSWEGVRAMFELDPKLAHFAAPILASHPKPVRDAIARHREGLDANTRLYMQENEYPLEDRAREAAANYLGTEPGLIALTDSTTMGLGLLYGGISLKPGHEIVTSAHDHYATHESLRARAGVDGVTIKMPRLYEDPADATKGSIVDAVMGAVTERTRVVALTWVHSVSGMKLPVREISDALARANRGRAPEDRALLCIDGVHGLGVEEENPGDLGCDFFIAGTHKWLWGPRGTGIVWGTPEAWRSVSPTIPTFDIDAYRRWIERQGRADAPPGSRPPAPGPLHIPPGRLHTPGGFHSFEHRWALTEAFEFHENIGRTKIAARTRALASLLKDALVVMDKVEVVTPRDPAFSSGLVVLWIDGHDPYEVVGRLEQHEGIIASVTPYAESYVRLAPSIVNGENEVDQVLDSIEDLARTG